MPQRGRIRVVIADSDKRRGAELAGVVGNTYGFGVEGIAADVYTFLGVLSEIVPDLVLCSTEFVPILDNLSETWPLAITTSGDSIPSSRYVASLKGDVSAGAIERSLTEALCRILNTKALEVSTLLDSYIRYDRPAPELLKAITGPVGAVTNICSDQVHWIRSSGHYVTLYTDQDALEVRESIQSIAMRLERLGFIRIHRTIVVNRASIQYLVIEDGVQVAMIVRGGTKLPIGPTFRGSIPGDIPVRSLQVITEGERFNNERAGNQFLA